MAQEPDSSFGGPTSQFSVALSRHVTENLVSIIYICKETNAVP